MTHIIRNDVILICGLLLVFWIVPYYYRHGKTERWVIRILFCLGLATICFTVMDVPLYWKHLNLAYPTVWAIYVTRDYIGGIAIGLFLSLLLSGQLWKIGKMEKIAGK